MSNSTAWVSSATQDNLTFVHTIIDMAFKAAGIATFAYGAYNYVEIVLAIARVARGHPHQHDQRIAEEGLREGGERAQRAAEAAEERLEKLNFVTEAGNLRKIVDKVRQSSART